MSFSFPEIVSISLYVLTTTFGMAANLTLLVVAAKKSPPTMKIYSVLLIFHSISNFVSCFASFLTIPRLIQCGTGVAVVFNGPCTLFGSHFCHQSYSLLFQSHPTSLYFLAASFLYRYYILIRPTPHYSTMIIISLLICLTSLIQFIIMLFGYEDTKLIGYMIEKIHPSYTLREGYALGGTINMFSGYWLFAVIFMSIPVVPVCCLIVYARLKITTTLNANMRLSECSRAIHQRLLQVLTIQASLLFCIIFAVLNYLCILLFVIEILEHFVIFWITIIPCVTPFISLVFIQPYRKVVLKRLRKHFCVARETNPVTCGHFTDRSYYK